MTDSQPAIDAPRAIPAAPPHVKDATYLMWASLGLFVLNAALHWDRYLNDQPPIGFVAIVGVCSVALWSWLITEISKGRNWARITALVLSVPGSLLFVISIRNIVSGISLADALNIVGGLMKYSALWLLFTDPGRLWFRSRENSQ